MLFLSKILKNRVLHVRFRASGRGCRMLLFKVSDFCPNLDEYVPEF